MKLESIKARMPTPCFDFLSSVFANSWAEKTNSARLTDFDELAKVRSINPFEVSANGVPALDGENWTATVAPPTRTRATGRAGFFTPNLLSDFPPGPSPHISANSSLKTFA